MIDKAQGKYEIFNLHVESINHSFFAEGFHVHNMDVKAQFNKKVDKNRIEQIEQSLKELELKIDKIKELELKIDKLYEVFGHLGEYLHKIRFTRVEPESKSTAESVSSVVLRIDKDFDKFNYDHQTNLIKEIGYYTGTTENSIKIIDISSGSVIVTLEMPEESALKLMKLWMNQDIVISTLKISSVEVKSLELKEQKPLLELPLKIDSKKISILFLSANPTDTSQLRLGEEVRSIETALRSSDFRDKFEIIQCWATRIVDIQSALLRHKPVIVHFSGHGSVAGEIILESNEGKSTSVSIHSLSNLFSILKDNIKCVVLNACFSEKQANAIADEIDCVIGMSKAIGDKSAIFFATSFYQALGYGRDVLTSFNLGCSQIDLSKSADFEIPQLIANKQNPSEIMLI